MTSSSSSSLPQDASSRGDVLDLSGEICPFTFVRTKLAMEQMPVGGGLRVIVDHEPAVRNIPRSAKEWGQRVDGTEALPDGRWAIDLTRMR